MMKFVFTNEQLIQSLVTGAEKLKLIQPELAAQMWQLFKNPERFEFTQVNNGGVLVFNEGSLAEMTITKSEPASDSGPKVEKVRAALKNVMGTTAPSIRTIQSWKPAQRRLAFRWANGTGDTARPEFVKDRAKRGSKSKSTNGSSTEGRPSVAGSTSKLTFEEPS